jgi:hypothetical protein
VPTPNKSTVVPTSNKALAENRDKYKKNNRKIYADPPTKENLKKMPKAGSGRWMPLLGTAGRIVGWSWMLFSVFKAGEEYVKTGSFKEAFGEFWETLFGGMLGDKQAVSGALSSIEESIKNFSSSITKGILKLINYDYEGEIKEIKKTLNKALKNPVKPNDEEAAKAELNALANEAQGSASKNPTRLKEINKRRTEILKQQEWTDTLTTAGEGPVEGSASGFIGPQLPVQKHFGESNINAPASKIVYPADQAELQKRYDNYKESTKEGSFKKADLEWYRKGATPSAMKNLQLLNGIVSLIKDDGVMKLSIQNPLSRSSLITMGGGTRAESFDKLNDSTKIKTNLLASIFERKGGLRVTSGYRTKDIGDDAMLHGANDLSVYKSKWTNTLTPAELTGKEGSDARKRGIAKMRLAGFSSQHEHGNAIDFSWPEGYNKNFSLIKEDIEATFPGAKLLKEKKHLHLAFNPKNDPKDIMDNFSNTHDNYLLAKNNGGVMKGGDVINVKTDTNHKTYPMTVALPEGATDKTVRYFT